MAGFQRTVWIERAPEEVFAFTTDFDNAPRWLTGVVRCEKLTEGPVRAGTRFKETRLMGKRECSAEIEVAAHDPPRGHAASSAFPGGRATYSYRFVPERGGTRVDLDAKVVGRGLGWLLVPLMASMMKKMDGQQLESLKQAIEK